MVLQLTLALLVVIPELETALIDGAVVSAAALVVNVKSPDVARLPAASRDLTR